MNQETEGTAVPPREITIFDTTLRDGEQAPGNAMAPEDKLDMALRLEKLGVDVIEVGFPAASPSDRAATRMIAEKLSTSTVATFCRSTRSDIEIAVEAVGVERHQVQVLATASELHLQYKRGITSEEAILELKDAVRFAASLGLTNISVALEDSSRGSTDLLRALTEASVTSGATTVVVCDTSGCMAPQEFGALVAAIRDWVPSNVVVSSHCHDDMGLALANALAAVHAGADQVQTTLGGVGERAGNTALEELAAVLAYKGKMLGAGTHLDTKSIYDAYLALSRSMRLGEIRNKAILGGNAFSTAAGIHQAGVLQKPETYEYLEPSRFGRERAIVISRHSGRAVVRHLAEEQGEELPPDVIDQLYDELIAKRMDSNTETLNALSARVSGWLADHANQW